MNLFGLFGRKKADTSIPNPQQPEAVAPDFTVGRDVFVDEEPPRPQDEAKKLSVLEEFLSHNYEGDGFHEGYFQHNCDGLESKVRSLEARFRLLVDRQIEAKRSLLYELRQDLCRIEGVSSRLEKELKDKAAALQEVVGRLEEQKSLSVDHEGYFAWVAKSYEQGYKRGIEQYYQEKALGINTGLF